MIEEIEIIDYLDLIRQTKPYGQDTRWCYRGQANVDWKLIPKAGREPFRNSSDEFDFNTWKRRAVEFVSVEPNNDWDWLVIAQHHGLPTRLMDWTQNPLVAAFFASIEQPETDGIIYMLYHEKSIDKVNSNPFDLKKGFFKFRPSANTNRVVRQNSLFTIQKDPKSELDRLVSDERLRRLIIKKELKNELILDLNFYGYNKYTLFPGLDGLSEYMSWYIANKASFQDKRPEIMG